MAVPAVREHEKAPAACLALVSPAGI